MPFKTPRPVYDAEQVRLVEADLDQEFYTRLIDRPPGERAYADDDRTTVIQHSVGGRTQLGRIHVRPMIQVIPLDVGSATPRKGVGCAACGDFSRSWNCDRHDLDRALERLIDAAPALTRGIHVSSEEAEAIAESLRNVIGERYRPAFTLLPSTPPRRDAVRPVGTDGYIQFEIENHGFVSWEVDR